MAVDRLRRGKSGGSGGLRLERATNLARTWRPPGLVSGIAALSSARMRLVWGMRKLTAPRGPAPRLCSAGREGARAAGSGIGVMWPARGSSQMQAWREPLEDVRRGRLDVRAHTRCGAGAGGCQLSLLAPSPGRRARVRRAPHHTGHPGWRAAAAAGCARRRRARARCGTGGSPLGGYMCTYVVTVTWWCDGVVG